MRAIARVVRWMLLIVSGCYGGGSPFAKVDGGDGGSAQGSGQSDAGKPMGTGGRAGSGGTGGNRSPGSGGAGGMGSGGTGGGAGGTGGSTSSDPCATNNGGCDPLVTCSASGSSVTCGACPSGYDDANGNGKRCTDTDECATDNGGCGSATYYSCKNNVGAAPTCADIDECATDNGGCDTSPMTMCINHVGAAATCDCPGGYTGDGVGADGCTDIDECATDNGGCGSATYWTCANNAGAAPTCTDIDECQTNNGGCGNPTYWLCSNNVGAAPSCGCTPGYTSVNGNCVCDLNGTFAMQVTTTESWTGIQYIENASQVVSKSWSIRLQSYDASGKLAVSTEPCGGTSPDLCGTGISAVGVPAEAYAAFLPNNIWRGANMPIWTFKDPPGFTITNALPGQPYVEPQTAALLGISLTDPFGAWPASRANVSGGGGTQTNGAAWVDADSDGRSGVMNYDVPPGGVLSASSPFPPQDYGATSTACPRSSSGARRSYAYVPAYDGGVVRVKRFSNAARVISQLSGTIGSSCDTLTGSVIGPQSGQQQVDGRVYDCVAVSGSGEAACSAAVVNALDAPAGGTHTFDSVTFIVKRVTAGTTCDQIRAMSF